MDARPPVASLFDAFGVPGTVTPPDEAAIDTTVVWLTPNPAFQPGGESYRRDGQKILALRRDEVPRVPTGTLIQAADVLDGEVFTWKVDGIDLVEQDHTRVFVLKV
jgi:hypothetical protein